jgi:Polysaccharide pyruvyl transferase.
MKKIGILTYHRVINDGSALQAYCLFNYLSRHFPSSRVELIDYCGRSTWLRELKRCFARRYPFYNKFRREKARSQIAFLRRYCAFSKGSLTSDSLHKARRFVEAQNYDMIVVGSDTVWEVRQGGGGPIPPNIFFLPGLAGPRKVSFAASSSKTDPRMLGDETLCAELKNSIDGFDAIMVRDAGTIELLLKLGISRERIGYMPDPTIVGEFPRFPDAGLRDRLGLGKGLVAGVAIGDKTIRQEAFRSVRAMGYSAVSFLGSGGNGVPGLPTGLSVEQRVAAHRDVDLFVTDRFHGSIFTILQTPTPVILVEEKKLYPDGSWKGRDLFSRLGAEEMLWIAEGQPLTAEDVNARIEFWRKNHAGVQEALRALKDAGRERFREMMQSLV